MSGKRSSLFGPLKEPAIFNLRMSPFLLSSFNALLFAVTQHVLAPTADVLGDHPLLIQTIFDHTMYLDSRDMSLAQRLLRQGCWEPDVTRLFVRIVKPGMRVVEVGVNVDYYTLLACSLVGRWPA
jgi:hypothetical protein